MKKYWIRFKNWWTIDHVVDLLVDALLLLWDVISSPVLIVVRTIRYFIGETVVNSIKSALKSIVYWFAKKREYRKANGHGIFRTYWFLILPSPIYIFILFFLAALATGIIQDFDVMLELLLTGCKEGSAYWCNTDLW